MMAIPTLSLARAQFLSSLSFLALFMALSLALAWMLLYFKLSAVRTGKPGWTAAYRFWVRFFALSFVLMLVGSVPVLVQLGGLWAGLMEKIGNVAGPLLGYTVMTVFILKSCFLGVMLFGQRRVSERTHTLAVFMVAAGMLVATCWVLALQSWMQTPAGAKLVDGRYLVYDWVAVVFNPSFVWRLGQVTLGAALAVAFLIIGVSGFQVLRRPLNEGERCAFKAALITATLASVLQVPLAWGAAQQMAAWQPAKAAAAAGFWDSGAQPAWVLFGWPDVQTHKNWFEVSIPNTGGRWLHRDQEGVYQGLDQSPNVLPPVIWVFWSLRVALGLGLLMLIVSCATLLKTRSSGFDPSGLPRWWLRGLYGMMYAGSLAVIAQWCLSIVGLQPFAVNGTVTQAEILGPSSASTLFFGLAGYGVLYAVLVVTFARMLFHAVRYGVIPVRKQGGATP